MKYLILVTGLILSAVILNEGYSQTRVLGDIIWQIQVPDNPGPSLQDKQVRSLKQISDVNGDGINDVVVAAGNYLTLCFSGANGIELWRFSSYFGSINSGSVEWEDAVDISDVNSDGIKDVVIGCAGGNEMVYALNGLNGNVLWQYGSPTTTSDGDIEAINIRYDFNNDGINDVIVSASGVTNGGRHALICLNAVNGQEIFYRMQPEPFTDDAIATQSGGAIGVNNNGAPYIVRGFNSSGNNIWSYTTTGNIWSLKEIPDINGDGIKDVIGLGGFTASIFGIAGNNGIQVWARTLGSSNNGKLQLLNDADSNGYADFTLSAPQIAYRLDTHTGNILWSNPLSSSYIRGIDNIGDITGDGIDDIVLATQVPARLLVLNGASGAIMFEHFFGSTISQRGDRAAVLNDIDSNGVNEFLGGNREGKVICFYGGNGIITSTNSYTVSVPEGFSLEQNFPNPFNPVTRIAFSIPVRVHTSLTVYNTLGKQVAKIIDEPLPAGRHEFEFDAGENSSGVYIYKLTAGDFAGIKKMLLVR